MIKCKSMEENRYKIPEDKAMVGMAAEPTPAVRASLSVQEMRHCLIDAIYSSKDIDKLHTCLVILNSKSNNVRVSIVLRRMKHLLQNCRSSLLGMKRSILICRMLIIDSISTRNLQKSLKLYQNGCN